MFLSILKFFRKEVKTTDFKNIRKVSSKLIQILQNPRKKRFFYDVEDSSWMEKEENMTFWEKKSIILDENKNAQNGGVEQLGSSSGS